MSNPVLFGNPLSPFARKARLILLHRGIDHEYRLTNPHADDAEFQAASPLGKIPAFKDNKTCFADSTAILHYTNKYYDGPALMPEAPADYVQALWYEEYADTILVPVMGGHLFAEVVLAERLFNREPNQADIDKALNEELPKIYAFLDARLAGKTWLVGDAFSIADLAVGGVFHTLYHCGQTVPDSAPNLQAFIARVFALDCFQASRAQELQICAAIGYDSPLAN